jgi:hypothetical protein
MAEPFLGQILLVPYNFAPLLTDKLSATMQIARRLYALAQEQNDSAQLIGACRAPAGTLHHLGRFEAAREHAKQGVQLWKSGVVR